MLLELICLVLCGYQTLRLVGIRAELAAAHPYNPEISMDYLYISVIMLALVAGFLVLAFVTRRNMKQGKTLGTVLPLHGALLVISVLVLRSAWTQGYNYGVLADEGLYHSSVGLWAVLGLQIPAMVAIVVSALCAVFHRQHGGKNN